MKKLFIKSLMTVGVAGLVGLTSVAMAAEFNWYGSIRAGVVDTDAGLDLGATGNDGGGLLYSRIGIKGSTDLGNGQSAGVQLERGIGDTLSVRHHNVWIGGGWGKLTFGQQGNPYRSVANWDQSWFLGGNARSFLDGGSRFEGVKYSSNLAGPFSFDVMFAGNDSLDSAVDRWITTAHYAVGATTINLGYNSLDTAGAGAISNAVADTTDVVSGSIQSSSTGISANGSVGGFGWYLAYDRTSIDAGNVLLSVGGATATFSVEDVKGSSIGAFVSYAVNENDVVYLEYETFTWKGLSDKTTASIVGYSHNLGDGISFIAEYANVDALAVDEDVDTLNLVLKYDF